MTTNEVLMNCIAAFLGTAELREDAGWGLDWQELIRKAEEQKVLPMVYEVLGASMPENEKRVCKGAVLRGIVTQTQRTADFLSVYRSLAAAGLFPVVVKGIVCRSVYEKPDYRMSADEDLYVSLDSYPAFHAKMIELGFSAEEPDYDNAHEIRYLRNGLLIEGHWTLFPQENHALNALNGILDGFWDRTVEQDFNGVSCRVMEPTDHFLFLLLHAYKHFVASGVGVRQIVDIAQWSKHYDVDWNRVQSAMKEMGGEYFAAAIFDAGETYFGMTYPADWVRADSSLLLEDALDGGIYGNADMNRKHSASMTLEAVEASKAGTKGTPLRKALFPNRAVMERNFPWVKKSALLLPAAWIIRIVRYLCGERKSAAESVRIGSERMELLKEYRIIP